MPIHTCTNCGIHMKIEKTGVFLITMFSNPPRPYKLHSGDLHKCSQCGETLHVANHLSLYEHFQPEFKEALSKLVSDPESYILQFEHAFDSNKYSSDLKDYLVYFSGGEEWSG